MLPGPRLLSYGMVQLLWAGGPHVTRFLYSRDTNLHLPMVLAMLVSAGEFVFSPGNFVFSPVNFVFSPGNFVFSLGKLAGGKDFGLETWPA